MKRVSVFVIAMVLTFTLCQLAFAYNYTMAASMGYTGSYDLGKVVNNGIKMGMSGEFSFNSKASLIGEADFGILFPSAVNDAMMTLDFGTFAKYDFFEMDIANAGVQAGFSGNMMFLDDLSSTLFMSVGLYGDIFLFPKINVYANLKLPIAAMSKMSGTRFFGAFLYDVKFGIAFYLIPNIFMSLESFINNTDSLSFASALAGGNAAFRFGSGFNVGYRF